MEKESFMGEKSNIKKDSEAFITVEDLYYSYQFENNEMGNYSAESTKVGSAGGETSEEVQYALRGINLEIKEGENIAVIGANGSGKSTLLRHFNALLTPTSGNVWVSGWNTKDQSHLRDIRSRVGMVFQNPDSQIVATVVEEEVAFGPENLGIPHEELEARVEWALEEAGIATLKQRPSHQLSGGEKQLLAIASVLAMKPRCILLDEATSMLDPASRRRFLKTVERLHSEGITIVAATHNMEEAASASRVIILSGGCMVLDGDPVTVFSREWELKVLGAGIPPAVQLAKIIAGEIEEFPQTTLSIFELLREIESFARKRRRTI